MLDRSAFGGEFTVGWLDDLCRYGCVVKGTKCEKQKAAAQVHQIRNCEAS